MRGRCFMYSLSLKSEGASGAPPDMQLLTCSSCALPRALPHFYPYLILLTLLPELLLLPPVLRQHLPSLGPVNPIPLPCCTSSLSPSLSLRMPHFLANRPSTGSKVLKGFFGQGLSFGSSPASLLSALGHVLPLYPMATTRSPDARFCVHQHK